MSCEYMNIALEEAIAGTYEQKFQPWKGRLTFSSFECYADMLKKKV